jgi:hypothetical protein
MVVDRRGQFVPVLLEYPTACLVDGRNACDRQYQHWEYVSAEHHKE